MPILHLPLEILDLIIYHSILARTLPRALRLKLVCKSFRASFHRTFFHTRVLDDYKWDGAFRDMECGIRKDHGAALLWHDYLVFRCRQKPGGSRPIPRIDEIRSVADALIQYRQGQPGVQDHASDLDEVLDRLCWLAVDCCKSGEEFRAGWAIYREQPNLSLSTLSAATYFGYRSLVRHLLDQGHDPTTDDYLFPSPMYIAARTGQADMLMLLQEHLPQFEHDTPQLPIRNWRSKIGPGSLDGACARGDLEMVRLCLYPPSRVISEEGNLEERQALILGHKPESIPDDLFLGNYIRTSMLVSRSPEVYQYLDSLVAPPSFGPPYYPALRNLELMAQAGNLAMVRHQLDNGANPSHGTYLGEALAKAVRACNPETTDLLLERGADPYAYDFRGRTILTAAAKTGSMTMMRKLLDAGAKVDEPTARSRGDFYTLWQAVKLEHRPMVEMLLDMGAGTEDGRAHTLRMADAVGMESMADLLRSRGITRGESEPAQE